MKKLFSTLLLVVFLFNVGGYYLVIWGLQTNHEITLLKKLDKNIYPTDEAITLKIPLTMPYPIYESDFVRVNGEFEYQGEFYRMVKQNLAGDTLTIVCIKDDHTKKLQATMADFAEYAADVPASSKKDSNTNVKPLSEYETIAVQTWLTTNGWCMNVGFPEINLSLLGGFQSINSPPPKFRLS